MKIFKPLLVLSLITEVTFGSDYIDINYSKNKNTERGVITKNIYNDHVKSKISDENILAYKYSDINKFTQNKAKSNGSKNYLTNKPDRVNSSNDIDLGFAFKVGFFNPSEKSIKETYGIGLFLGGEIIFWKNNKGIKVCYENYKNNSEIFTLEGLDVIDANRNISITPISISGLYRIRKDDSDGEPYFGIGIGSFKIKENLKANYYDTIMGKYVPIKIQTSDEKNGILFLAGLTSNHIFIEAKYTNTTIYSKDKYDAGGISITIGIKL